MKIIRGCNTKLALSLLIETEIFGKDKDLKEKYRVLKKVYEKE